MLGPLPTLPPFVQERIVCSVSASVEFKIPANILLAVAETENGRPGQWVRNSNATYDLGPLQFNTSYLRSLKKYGITRNDVLEHGCYPYRLAAWRIANHIAHDKGSIFQRVANYHSRTTRYNTRYQTLLKPKAKKWKKWLAKNYSKNSNFSMPKIIEVAQTQRGQKPADISAHIGYVPRGVVAVNE